jgi:hypothetical protein
LGEDEFAITLMRFGPVFWIDAAEFDPIDYFDSLRAAKEYAEGEYEPYVSAANEE